LTNTGNLLRQRPRTPRIGMTLARPRASVHARIVENYEQYKSRRKEAGAVGHRSMSDRSAIKLQRRCRPGASSRQPQKRTFSFCTPHRPKESNRLFAPNRRQSSSSPADHSAISPFQALFLCAGGRRQPANSGRPYSWPGSIRRSSTRRYTEKNGVTGPAAGDGRWSARYGHPEAPRGISFGCDSVDVGCEKTGEMAALTKLH